MLLVHKICLYILGCIAYIFNRGVDASKANLLRKALGTHVKISQLVASLQTSRQQVVFALLVTSCQQVWNKLLATCSKIVDILSDLLQGCSNQAVTIMI